MARKRDTSKDYTNRALDKYTVKELKEGIKQRTDSINKLLKVNGDLRGKFAVEQTIQKLQKTGAIGRRDNVLGYGLSKSRTKESLYRQLRELEYAEPLLSDYKGIEYLEEKYRSAKDSFLGSLEYSNMSEKEWRDVVETFGALGKEIVQRFDSTSIAEHFSEATHEIDMVKLMQDTLKETKGMGLSQQALTEYFINNKLTPLIG